MLFDTNGFWYMCTMHEHVHLLIGNFKILKTQTTQRENVILENFVDKTNFLFKILEKKKE